ncbi:MAG: thiamine pyrophosphate-dependent enzyme [Acidobacteria bacterium]|nr:thiamine pyrophosphate-dependent enzyme [Acidobacteriota bacterium]
MWQTGLHDPSCSAYARLCGGHGIRVTNIERLRPALNEALARKGPSLVEIITDVDLI